MFLVGTKKYCTTGNPASGWHLVTEEKRFTPICGYDIPMDQTVIGEIPSGDLKSLCPTCFEILVSEYEKLMAEQFGQENLTRILAHMLSGRIIEGI